MSRLRVVLAGAGMVSRYHQIAWSRCPQAELVGVADPDPARAQMAIAQAPGAQAFGDVAAMLDALRPDAIDVATPLETHAGIVRLAVSRGVAVLCQKPLAATHAAGVAIAREVGDRGRVMVHENWRFRPVYRQVKRWVAQGRLGRVRAFALTAASGGLVPPAAGGLPPRLISQPFVARMPRFLILELLIHHLDVARWLIGPLRVVAAQRAAPEDGFAGEMAAHILLEGPGGVLGFVAGDMRVPGAPIAVTDRLEIVGAAGTVTFDGASLAFRGASGEAETMPFEAEAGYQAGYDAAIAHFVARLRDGGPFETDIADNLATIALVDAAYRAAGA